MLTIITAEWVSYLKPLLIDPSHNKHWLHLPAIYNGKQQWQKHHWLNPDLWPQKHKSSNKKIYHDKNKAQSYWNPGWAGTLI